MKSFTTSHTGDDTKTWVVTIGVTVWKPPYRQQASQSANLCFLPRNWIIYHKLLNNIILEVFSWNALPHNIFYAIALITTLEHVQSADFNAVAAIMNASSSLRGMQTRFYRFSFIGGSSLKTSAYTLRCVAQNIHKTIVFLSITLKHLSFVFFEW